MGGHNEADCGKVDKNLEPGTKGHCRVINHRLERSDRSRKPTLKDVRTFFPLLHSSSIQGPLLTDPKGEPLAKE